MSEQSKRNLNPHAEAIAAMWLYGREYAAQSGGAMDFWDWLSPEKKRLCTQMVERILAAKPPSPQAHTASP